MTRGAAATSPPGTAAQDNSPRLRSGWCASAGLRHPAVAAVATRRRGDARGDQRAACRPGPRLPGQQRLGGQRAEGARRRRHAGRRPAAAADPAVGLVSRSRCPRPASTSTGVSVPGLPGVLIGHNQHIAWSLTDTQNRPRCSTPRGPARAQPGQYFWHGSWRTMRQFHYTIEVRGEPARQLTVGHTVHGPVHDAGGPDDLGRLDGQRAVPDVAVLQQISTAQQLHASSRAALANWQAPGAEFRLRR